MQVDCRRAGIQALSCRPLGFTSYRCQQVIDLREASHTYASYTTEYKKKRSNVSHVVQVHT
jgi:hypothetical protein